jgi:protease I
MDADLQGKRIAFLVRERDVEQELPLWEPIRNAWEAVRNAGGTPHHLYNGNGTVEAVDHLPKDFENWKKRNMRVFVKDVSASDYDGLVLPSSVAKLDTSQMDQEAQEFVERFLQLDGPTLVTVFKKRNM